MSDATLAFWAAMGGGVLAGAFSVAAVSLSNRAAASREAQRLQHEAEMAAEVRHQDRIERAYLHLLQVVNEGWALMERDSPTHAAIDKAAVNDRVEMVFAELDAFGSDSVKEIFGRWRVPWGLFTIDIHNARIRAASGAPDSHDLHVLDQHRSDARTAAKELAERVAVELRGGHGNLRYKPQS